MAFDGPSGNGAHETYSNEGVPTVVKVVMSSTTLQEDITAKWSKYDRKRAPLYVVVHRKGEGNEAELRFCVLTNAFSSADRERDSSKCDKNVRNRRFRQDTTKTTLEENYYRVCSVGTSLWSALG